MGIVIKVLALAYRFMFGGTLLGKVAMWAGIAVVGLVGVKTLDWADDRAAIRKHEQKKTEHVRKKITKARRAGRRVRTNADVRRVLENAADRN